ncbi:hypothetical protein TKK_0005835 [Trichogramma kaykai]
MLSDLCSASGNLLEDALFHKRSEDERTPDLAYSEKAKRYYFYYKRSQDDQQNLEEVKRPGGHFMVGKRSLWYPLFHKRSEDKRTPDLAHSERAKRYYFYY